MPSTDVTLLFEEEGFSNKTSSSIGLSRGGSLSSVSPLSKNNGFSLKRTKSLVSWRKQDVVP